MTTATWARTVRGWRLRIASRSDHVSSPTSRCRQMPADESRPAPSAIQTTTTPTSVSSRCDRRKASATSASGGVQSARRSIAPLYREAVRPTTIPRVDGHIEVNAMAVRHALARTFTGVDPQGHAWRGTTGVGEGVVTVDVEARAGDAVYVHVWAPAVRTGPLTPVVARVLAAENGELVLGRFAHRGEEIMVEHTILAGTTMDPVEVQSSVWTVGWAASAYDPRLRALLTEAVPVPPAPQTPAARLRDAGDHVEMTTRRVRRYLEAEYGGFDHHPDWGYHGGFGSARVFVDVLPVLDDSTAVRASSPVLSDIDLTDDLALELMRLAATSPFGCYSYQPARREVWFEHVILGDDLDRPELEAAIQVVADTADGQDDTLAGRFGGRRYADL